MPLIAEDLGIITPEVEALRQALGLPGMKILLFAFDYFTDNSYLPYNCPPNSVIYTGTHDNETAVGWFLNPAVDPVFKQQAKRFANKNDDNPGSFHTDLIYLAMSASSNLAIFPMQDLLGFGNDCRMNTPGQSKGNWLWRVAPHYINDDLAAWLRELTRFFGRLPAQTPQHKQQAHNDAHPYS
jgi:4-alpha-glucanotransferase